MLCIRLFAFISPLKRVHFSFSSLLPSLHQSFLDLPEQSLREVWGKDKLANIAIGRSLNMERIYFEGPNVEGERGVHEYERVKIVQEGHMHNRYSELSELMWKNNAINCGSLTRTQRSRLCPESRHCL